MSEIERLIASFEEAELVRKGTKRTKSLKRGQESSTRVKKAKKQVRLALKEVFCEDN